MVISVYRKKYYIYNPYNNNDIYICRFWIKGEESGERYGKIFEIGKEDIYMRRYETTPNVEIRYYEYSKHDEYEFRVSNVLNNKWQYFTLGIII